MRRAQDTDKASLPYTKAASGLLNYLASQGVTDNHPLFEVRPIVGRLLIVVASDKGLAGAYNSNVFKAYLNELMQDEKAGVATKTITIGRRATQFATRLKQVNLIGAYDNLPDQIAGPELSAISDTARDMFIDGQVDAVDIIFTEFISSLRQEATIRRVLPAGREALVSSTLIDNTTPREALYEPSPRIVLDSIVDRLVEAQVFQTLLDARASEHSMRMVAMKNATDNATDLVDDLTLAMNKARQGVITQELSEISGGVEAMSN